MQKCIRALSRCAIQSWQVDRIVNRGLHHELRDAASACLYSSVSAAELQFGQPLHETHPHLLQPGELTPGITALEYAQRRSKLAAKLPNEAIAIIAAADVKYRSKDVFYEFHQDSNFFYLTGFDEPDALAVIGKSTAEDDHTFHLYVREKDPKVEQWDGVRSGTQAALDVFNADETGDIASITRHLEPIIMSTSRIFTDIPTSPTSKSFFSRFTSSTAPQVHSTLSSLLSKSAIHPLKERLDALRSLKSPAEIATMRQAGRASGRTLTSAMSQPWTTETALAAYLDYQFRINGCSSSAYIPVVAGGRNSSIIHYTANNHFLSPSEMVLVDAGGEYGGYIADITRTWPASGKFTDAQRDLYNAVLATQRHCVALCRANAGVSLDALHNLAESHLADSLRQLGFDDVSTRRLNTLFPHHLGHYVGLDVHDTPGLSRRDDLRAGQCVTIEPGIYVPDEEGWPKHFRGMGVRIEDSVAVGEEGPIVLSTEAVKEVDDIEALRA